MFIFMIITTYLWYLKTSSEAYESASTYVSEMLRVSNENFEVALRDINYIVSSSARKEEYVINILSKPLDSYPSEYLLLQDNRKIQDYLSNLYSYKHYLKGMMISDLNGRSYINGDMASFKNIKSQEWYKNILDSDNQSIFIPPHSYQNVSQTDSDNSNNDKVISIVRPIFYSDQVIGFVLADLQFNILEDIYNINLKDKGSVSIINTETDQFIYKSQHSPAANMSDNDLKSISTKFTPSKGSFNTKIAGKDTLVIFNYSNLTHWTTVGLIPKSQMLASYNKARSTVFLVLFVFLILGTLITYLITSVLTKNILSLNTAIKKINKDNIDISVAINSHDEIGQLYLQFNSMVIRIKELVNDIKKNEAAKRKAEMKVLQAQINPHFLYNTLNTIKFLSVLQGAENICNVSESLSRLMHLNMDSRVFISVEEEIQYIENYLKIQEYKYTNKFIYNIVADEDIMNKLILKLLLQPIVENALIHGIAPMKGQGILLIKLYREDNHIKLRVQDNGIGIGKTRIEEILSGSIFSSGIGLSNIISRIEINFGKNYGVTILSEPNLYTVVELSVPIINENEVNNYA